MVRGALPAAPFFHDGHARERVAEAFAHQHMIEAPALVGLRPVRRAIAPPRVAFAVGGTKRRRASTQGPAAVIAPNFSTSIGVWLTIFRSALWLQTSCSSGATLRSPTRIASRRAIPSCAHPGRHLVEEAELVRELRIDRRDPARRRRPARRNYAARSRGRSVPARPRCGARRPCRRSPFARSA